MANLMAHAKKVESAMFGMASSRVCDVIFKVYITTNNKKAHTELRSSVTQALFKKF